MSVVQLHWFKSSYSDTDDINDCVEVAATAGALHIRDSKRPVAPHLTVSPVTWAAFLDGVCD